MTAKEERRLALHPRWQQQPAKELHLQTAGAQDRRTLVNPFLRLSSFFLSHSLCILLSLETARIQNRQTLVTFSCSTFISSFFSYSLVSCDFSCYVR